MKLTILGHANIDVDAFISGVLLSNLLTFLKIDNEFIILEEVKEDDTYHIVKELFGIDMKDYYFKGESTSYMIYELMQEVGYQISAKEAKMIVASMMVDTVSFRSAKTVKEEAEKAREMAKQYGFNYEDIEKYCLCLTPIDDGTQIDTIINNGYKYYNYNGYRVKSSYIQIYGMVDSARIFEWISEIKKQTEKENLAIWVFIIFECQENVTYEYHITSHGETIMMSTDRILSRGTNIMPEVEKYFCNK